MIGLRGQDGRAAGTHPTNAAILNAVRQTRRRVENLNGGLFAIGIEILPYEMVGVVTDVDGVVHGSVRCDLVSMDVDQVVAKIADVAADLVTAWLDIDLSNPRVCLGVQLGGPVETDTGVVRFYANNPHDHGKAEPPYQWQDVDLADRIMKATGCAAVIENDAAAYAAYELRRGSGRETGSFAVVLIRHGVGAGVVIDNSLLRVPMEVGHLLVWPAGRLCDCGKLACIESRAGRRAIPAVVADKTKLLVGSFERAVDLANGNHDKAPQAVEAFAEAGTSIARGIATILTIFGSRRVVVYGPEALVVRESGRAANAFLTQVDTYKEYAFRHLGVECEVTTQAIELTNGAQGAALIALSRYFGVPLERTPEDVS